MDATSKRLTKEDIKALRAANDYVILRHHDSDTGWDGSITAVIKQRLHGVEVEARVEVAVGSTITNYEEGRASDRPASDEEIDALRLRADYMIHFPHRTGGTWKTVAAAFREGDELWLRWLRGNHNQITRELGLAVDEVSLEIVRGGKTVATFKVGHSVGKRNCARMVRSLAEQHTYIG
jgi:cell division GTPase FtsZ